MSAAEDLHAARVSKHLSADRAMARSAAAAAVNYLHSDDDESVSRAVGLLTEALCLAQGVQQRIIEEGP
jgi:hypothetical protein